MILHKYELFVHKAHSTPFQMQPASSLLLLTTLSCSALDIPWNPSVDMEEIVYFTPDNNYTRAEPGVKIRPHNKSENPQWLFFVSTEIVDGNNNTSSPLLEWEFVSHMTITPEQCGMITNVVQMLDDALQRANPEVGNVTSTALRIGNSDCVEGQCPCERETAKRRVRISHRLLEVKTRSSSPNLKPPMQRKLRVTSFKTLES